MNEEYGVFFGRFQPFHKGHDSIIQEIILDKKIPLIIIGSTNVKNEKNPLSFEERDELIRSIYGHNVFVLGQRDFDCWDTWYDTVINRIKMFSDNITIYAHNKESDRINFTYKGKLYENEFYTKVFEEHGFKIKNISEYTCKMNNVIHATDIRNDLEANKYNVDARIYRKLKDKYGW